MEEAKYLLFQDETVAEQKPVVCDDCGEIFLHQVELFNHKINDNSKSSEHCCSSVRKGNSSSLENFDNGFYYNIKLAIKDEIIKEEESTNTFQIHGNITEQSLSYNTSIDTPLELVGSNPNNFDKTDFDTKLAFADFETNISESLNTQICCQDCGKMCPNEISLIRHEKAHKINFTFVCEICGVFYKYKKSYESHLATHKEFRDVIVNAKRKEFQNSSFTNHQNAYKNGFPFACEVCGIAYKYKKSYMRHVATHKNRLPVTKYDLTLETQQTEEPKSSEFTRENCQASSSGESKTLTNFFASDITSLANEYPCICKTCGAIFESKHLQSKHICVSSRFFCKTCGEIFRFKNAFKRHKCVRTLLCNTCGAQCVTKKKLRRHKRTHPREKLSCEECNEVFAYNTQLQEHQLEHSQSETVFLCEECGRKFPSQNLLNRHQSIYYGKASTNYICSHCNMAFVCRSARQMHELSHDT